MKVTDSKLDSDGEFMSFKIIDQLIDEKKDKEKQFVALYERKKAMF